QPYEHGIPVTAEIENVIVRDAELHPLCFPNKAPLCDFANVQLTDRLETFPAGRLIKIQHRPCWKEAEEVVNQRHFTLWDRKSVINQRTAGVRLIKYLSHQCGALRVRSIHKGNLRLRT